MLVPNLRRNVTVSKILCPDGAELNVTISPGLSAVNDGSIVVVSFTSGEDCFRTWIAEEDYSDAATARILYNAKHSIEFRESLRVKALQYPQQPQLEAVLASFGKPAFVERPGNLEATPVHEELSTVLAFPEGFPLALEKAAAKTKWISLKRGQELCRMMVRAEYGHAHLYNARLLTFLGAALAGTLTKQDHHLLDLPSKTTILNTRDVKRRPVRVTADMLSESIKTIPLLPDPVRQQKLLRLKSYRDEWSGMTLSELRERCADPEVYQQVCRGLRDKDSHATALRWYLRGLSLEHAIEKTRLDLERRQDYLQRR